MQTQNIGKSIDEMTDEEFEAYAVKRRKKIDKKREKEKAQYEDQKEDMVQNLFVLAKQASEYLGELKKACHSGFETQAELLGKYGGLTTQSKGGFSVDSKDKTLRITRTRDTSPRWDERSTKAVELIKSFLADTVKKRDLDLYEILMGFLEKNANGDLEYARVMELYGHEQRFDDDRWREGLRLIKESYSVYLKGYGYYFRFMGEDGRMQRLELNFSSL